jgi:hypothetical protein
MKSENGRYGLAIIVIFAALAACLKIPAVLKPELSGFNPGNDDGMMLQAVWRAGHGLGYTVTHAIEGSDLSDVRGDYPHFQAPGVKWMMSAAGAAGLGRFDAYKLFYLLCAFAGMAGWLYIGKKLVGLRPLVVLGVLLAFFYCSGWSKLADIFVWSLVPYYLFFLAAACEEDKKALSPAVAATGAIGVLLVFFWYGGIYFGAAGALAVLALGKGGIRTRFLRGGLIAGLCAAALFALEAWIQPGASQALGKYESGFYLTAIPVSDYLPAASVLFGEAPLMAISRRIALFQLLPAKILYILPPIFLIGLALAAFKRNLLSVGQKKFFGIFFIHFCVLFLFLLYMSIRYNDPSIQGNVNNLVQADRYMRHLATAGELFWICAAWAWLEAALKGGFGKERRMVAAAVLVFAAAVLIFAAGMVPGNAYARIFGRGSANAAESAIRDALYKPYEFIANDIRAHSRGTVKVFDIEKNPYYIDGSINIYNSYYNAALLGETENTKPVFIYVVVRHELRKSLWYKDSAVYVKDAKFMANVLKLQKMVDYDNGGTEVYGGEVGPFAKGERAAAMN